MQYHPDTGICVTRITVSENFIGGIITMFLEATTTATTNGGSWLSLLIFPLLLVVMYFFMIRPQKKQEKEAQAMRNSLSIGDEVTTIGGIIGRVVNVKEETFLIETTKERTRIRFERSALKRIDRKFDAPEAATAAEEATEESK